MMKDRMLSTWDCSTNWIENVFGGFEDGTANLYGKEPEWFNVEYETMVDWCAKNGIGAIGVRGLLRDRHHDFWDPARPTHDMGVVEARQLCAYGRRKGVRIVLMAGLFDQGGVYFESGNYGPVSDWSLKTFLARHPECRGPGKDAGDPANPQMRQYALDSVDWVMKALPDLGGVQFDLGPMKDGQAAFADEVKRIVRAHSDSAWIVRETASAGTDPDCRDLFRVRKDARWTAAGRDELALEAIRRDCRRAADGGFGGVTMEAGASPHRANAEFNYLALAAFAENPSQTVADFVRTVMAPRLGGESAAARYVELADAWKAPEKIPSFLREIAAFAAKADDFGIQSRWFSLAEFLRKVRCAAEMDERDEGRAV